MLIWKAHCGPAIRWGTSNRPSQQPTGEKRTLFNGWLPSSLATLQTPSGIVLHPMKVFWVTKERNSCRISGSKSNLRCSVKAGDRSFNSGKVCCWTELHLACNISHYAGDWRLPDHQTRHVTSLQSGLLLADEASATWLLPENSSDAAAEFT